jgi:hypothetical protein
MSLSIIERKGLNVVDSEDLTGEAGDAINDNFYEIGDRLEVIENDLDNFARPTGDNIWTGENIYSGDVTFSGDVLFAETYWEDERVPSTSLKAVGSKPPDWDTFLTDGSGSQGVATFYFDKAAEQELYFALQLPHRWKEGTNIHAHVHWFPKASGGSGHKVGWGLEYTWASIGNVFSNTKIEYGDQHIPTGDVSLVPNKHYLTEIAEIDGSGQTLSSMLMGRVFRDATSSNTTDNYDDDAGILELDFHIQIDSLGSVEEYVKY